MFDDIKRIRGRASLALAVLISVVAIGCTAPASGAANRALGDQSARQSRLAGDPYQAGTRAPQKATGVSSNASRVGLTGTHPGGGGPQE
jgi:hypothetical protein